MATPQSAILAESGSAGLFLTLNVPDGADTALAVARQCAGVEQQAAVLAADGAADDAAPGLRVSVAFGRDFWDRLSPGKRPQHLASFEALHGVHDAPATGGDVFLHVHAPRMDLNFELARRFLARLHGCVEVLEEVHGFRYLDARDLTGFIDGTENPQGDERAAVALIGEEDAAFAAGSYVLAQRYVHGLETWAQLSVPEQERIIGRTKADSVELDDAERPNTAHISRVVIEEAGEELEILRHSMPYGQVAGESGLFFLAYGREWSTFQKMLARMFGAAGPHIEHDGLSDRLLEFTTAVSGAYFFAPSQETLQRWASDSASATP